jgi:acetylornithine deacetylase/succinyl-diaminopimelate desuccinylase-like protein
MERYIREVQPELRQLIRDLCAIPAPSHREEARAAFCRDWFRRNGGENVEIDEALNVICPWRVTEDGDLTVFMAHTDTVFPDTEPLPFREEGDMMYCPGVTDDTANLAVLMICARYIMQRELPTDGGIVFVANSCEEGLGNLKGCRAIVERYGRRMRELITLDDSRLENVVTRAVGSHRYAVTAATEGGHSFSGFGKRNAIQVLATLVDRLYRVEVPTEGDSRTTYNVGVISGGSTVNSIAQQASMMYEFRSSSQKCLDQMEKMFTEAVDSCRDCGGELEVKVLGIRPGNGDIDKDALAAFTARNSEVISAFYEGELDYAAYSTDSNIPLSMGIPANTIGAMVGAKAHTREEWVDLKSLTPGLKIALSLMLGYCGK